MSQQMENDENREKLVELAYKRSNDVLQAQAAIANATDQRALVFATLSIAAAALVFNALNKGDGVFFAKGAAIFFCVSAACTTISASPGSLYPAGSKASLLTPSINADISYSAALLGLANNNDEYIDANEKGAKWRAHFYRFAILLFGVGVGFSLLGFLLI